MGIAELLEQLIVKIPAPTVDSSLPSRALIIDSCFDNYLGVVLVGSRDSGILKKRAEDPSEKYWS